VLADLWHSDFSFFFFDSFTMPDVHSIGLGGGSRVRVAENGRVSVGPDSVGHHVCLLIFRPMSILFDLRNLQITRDSLVFGGGQLTATDIALCSGTLTPEETIGDPSKIELIEDEVVEKAGQTVKRMLEVGLCFLTRIRKLTRTV
jgi:N-methylhydantoinase A/oxoprolinase/acetone carboxylase beta subunit